MIVDDEVSIRDLFLSAFSEAGYFVHLAGTANRRSIS